MFPTLVAVSAALVALLFSLPNFARSPKPSLCEREDEVLNEVALDPEMRLAGVNSGGLLNGGVCWWHSRFQRAAWSLAEFAPGEEKPSPAKVKRIVHDLAHLRVTRIPGYADLISFSMENWNEIQKELNQWQSRDAFTNQAWVRGLSQKARYSPWKAHAKIRELYWQFKADSKRGRITWVKLQMPGITAHSALILDMNRNEKGEYEMKVVDSNEPTQTLIWTYRPGERSMDSSWYGSLMPFAGYQRDHSKIEAARRAYCRRSETINPPPPAPVNRAALASDST